MKKLFLLALVLVLASCGQNNVTDTNTGASISTEKTEVVTEKVIDKNAELRAKLEKMAEEYAKTEKYTSFADFENATGLKLGNDVEVLPEDKDYAGVAVSLVKDDFVLMSTSMGKGGIMSFYQLKDGKLEFIIGGNGDAPIEQCEKFDSLNVPAEFSRVKEQLCNYTR